MADCYSVTTSYTGWIISGVAALAIVLGIVFNLKTAKTLGLEVPVIMQQRADKLIE